jgi:hypothetical protein
MISPELAKNVTIEGCENSPLQYWIDPELVSIVGHEDTARILGVPFNRKSVKLREGDKLYVAQYDGPRLPEGATALPEGAKFIWYEVRIRMQDQGCMLFASLD